MMSVFAGFVFGFFCGSGIIMFVLLLTNSWVNRDREIIEEIKKIGFKDIEDVKVFCKINKVSLDDFFYSQFLRKKFIG